MSKFILFIFQAIHTLKFQYNAGTYKVFLSELFYSDLLDEVSIKVNVTGSFARDTYGSYAGQSLAFMDHSVCVMQILSVLNHRLTSTDQLVNLLLNLSYCQEVQKM